MPLKLVRYFAAVCALATCAAPLRAQQWRMQYLYDEAKSTLAIRDLQFPSAARGVAVGVVSGGRGDKAVALITSDGGAHWQTVPLKEDPLSLFFLNESLGWMVTDKGLWRTSEAGKDWTKLPSLKAPILRVAFVDEHKGWAVGLNRTMLATTDGGQHWTPVASAALQPGDAKLSAYTWISFASPRFAIALGTNEPRRMQRFPDWLDPKAALGIRETPHLSLMVQTADGGDTWKPSSASMFGDLTRARFGPPGKGLGLVEHAASFQYPSEVFELIWPTGKNDVVYRDKSFFVSDVWVTPEGVYYLAGVTALSRLHSVVPQKVKVLRSEDLKQWTPLSLDYRAVANRATLAGAGGDLWLATNNGMILKLAR